MRHKGLRLESRFPRKKIWPWVGLAAALLAIGVVEVSIHAQQGTARGAPAADSGRSGGGAPAVVPSGRSAVTPPGAGISGVVRLPSGSPAADVGVYVEPDGREARTDARGAFHLDIADDAIVRLHAHHSDVGFGSVEVVAPNGNVSITVQPRATFDVRVMRSGQGVPGAQVAVEETVERVYEADHLTDADGRVRVRGLPSGQLRARATLPSGARGFTDADAHEGETVEVTVQLRGP